MTNQKATGTSPETPAVTTNNTPDSSDTVGIVKRYLEILDPSPEAVFNIEAYSPTDKETGEVIGEYVNRQWSGLSQGAVLNLIPELTKLNAKGAAIYVAVNEFKGARKKENLARVRCVHADFDKPTAAKDLKASTATLSPTLVVQSSPNKFHAYWRLREGEILTGEEVEGSNRFLINEFSADSAASDCSRLLRLPGFNHTKGFNQGHTPEVLLLNEGSKIGYTAEEVTKAFPPVAKAERHTVDAKSKPQVRLPISTEAIEQIAQLAQKIEPEIWAGYEQLPDTVDKSRVDDKLCCTIVRAARSRGVPEHQLPELVEDIFMRSGIAKREKVQNRPDYVSRTVAQAIAKAGTFEEFDIAGVPLIQNGATVAIDPLAHGKQLELPIEDALVATVNQEYLWDAHGLQIYSLKTRMYVRKDGFMNHYQNRKVQVASNRSVSLGSYWMGSPQRRSVNGLVLSPSEGEITSTGAFNTWRGYSHDPVEGDISPFTDVFNHLLPDETNRDFVMKWLAKLIQHPEIPFKVALAIHGRMQGTGKNTIFEAVAELLHPQHWKLIGNAQLTSTFNDWQLDKVFVIGDEVSNASSRSDADLMKRYITATENSINPKGLPALRQKNLIKYVLLSNRDEIVHIEGEDRRYYVAETNSSRLPDPVRDRFYAWKEAGGLAHLLFQLLHFDASDFDPTAPAPMTDAKAGVIEAGKSGLDIWVEEEVSERVARGKLLASTADLLSRYQMNARNSTSDKAMSNALQRAGGLKLPKQAVLESGRRIRLYSLAEHEKYQGMSDSELGNAFEAMPLY